jgi:hypothetical protein
MCSISKTKTSYSGHTSYYSAKVEFHLISIFRCGIVLVSQLKGEDETGLNRVFFRLIVVFCACGGSNLSTLFYLL